MLIDGIHTNRETELQYFSRHRLGELFLARADSCCRVKRTFCGPLFAWLSLFDNPCVRTYLRSEGLTKCPFALKLTEIVLLTFLFKA